MSFSLKLAVQLAGEVAKLYVVDGKVMSKKSPRAFSKTTRLQSGQYMEGAIASSIMTEPNKVPPCSTSLCTHKKFPQVKLLGS
jgi:hypothetical protein